MSEHDRAAAMREEFDLGFADPPAKPPEPELELLLIRVGGEPFAILQSDVASIHAGLSIVPLPSRRPELLGVATVRREIVPVYDLRPGLGLGGHAAPRWVVIVKGTTIALAFDRLEGTTRIRSRTLAPATLLDLRAVLAAVTKET